MKDKPVRQRSLTRQVLGILNERIEHGVYPPDSQLPSESNLVDELEVSRATIRRALDILEANGKVIRRHGVGSFISAATKINNPINEPVLFQTLIKNSGYRPGVVYIDTKISAPKPEIAQALKIEEDHEVVEFYKAFTAGGEGVIYLLNTIPAWVLGEDLKWEILSKPQLTEPVFEFLERYCNQRLIYYISSIKADVMANCPCEGETFSEFETALVFDEIAYNQDDIPIMHSVHYYPGDNMKFELVRRRAF